MNERSYPCEYCDTDLAQEAKQVTVTRTRRHTWYIFEDVPAWVCPNCGHRYFDDEVVVRMEARMTDQPNDARPIEAWAISLGDKP